MSNTMEMRHEEQLVDYKIKEIINDLGYKRFRGEEIDEEYERDCEIRIHKLKQDFNIRGEAKLKKEKATKKKRSSTTFLSHSDNSLPEFESFSDHTEETRSGSTTTHANYSLPEYESFHFDNPSFSRPPPEPPDVENLEPEINNFYVLNNDEPFDPEEGENVVFLNVEEDDSFTFTIRTFLPFVTYPEVSPLSCSTGSEDTIFDPGIFT
ncbi:hypothetical protein Tco_1576602 [Tanacetum coccineum]